MPPKVSVSLSKAMPSSASSLGKKRKKKYKKPSWEVAMERAMVEMTDDKIQNEHPQVIQAFRSNVDNKNYENAYKEMKHEWHLFKYSNDLKDMYISKLKDDMDILQEQRLIMKFIQMEHIDDLLADYTQTVEKAVEDYKLKRDRLMRERFTFMNRNFKATHDDTSYVAKMKDSMVADHEREMDSIKGINVFQKDEQTKMSKDQMEYLQQDMLTEMLETYCAIRNVYNTYVKKTEKKRRAFALLKAKDKEDDIIIEKLRDKIANLHVERENITKRMKLEHKNITKIGEMEMEKMTLVDMLNKMRSQLKSDYSEDGSKLMHLTNNCNSVIKELEEKEHLIQKILKYIVLSQKYETLQEKIQPYSNMIERIDIAFNDEFPEYRDLDKFLFRMAQVEIHVEYMQKLLEKYKQQEETLKTMVCEAVNAFDV